jgi:hypothetical protein
MAAPPRGQARPAAAERTEQMAEAARIAAERLAAEVAPGQRRSHFPPPVYSIFLI